jgi:hypothetical protein
VATVRKAMGGGRDAGGTVASPTLALGDGGKSGA